MNDNWRSRGLGVLLLAVWAIFAGLVALFKLTFDGEQVVLGIMLVGAGVLLLIGR